MGRSSRSPRLWRTPPRTRRAPACFCPAHCHADALAMTSIRKQARLHQLGHSVAGTRRGGLAPARGMNSRHVGEVSNL